MRPRDTLIEAGVGVLFVEGDWGEGPRHVRAVAALDAFLAHPAEVIAALCTCETCGGDGVEKHRFDMVTPSGYSQCSDCGGSGVDGVRREAALRALGATLQRVPNDDGAGGQTISADGTRHSYSRPQTYREFWVVPAFPAPVGDDTHRVASEGPERKPNE